MAVGNTTWPEMHAIRGIALGACNGGIKDNERDDVLLIAIGPEASVAGVFTKNAFCAAPVKICQQHMEAEQPRFFIVNSGNANACTGELGRKAALACCEALAEIADVSTASVLPFSTGVIGEPLPFEKIISVLPDT